MLNIFKLESAENRCLLDFLNDLPLFTGSNICRHFQCLDRSNIWKFFGLFLIFIENSWALICIFLHKIPSTFTGWWYQFDIWNYLVWTWISSACSCLVRVIKINKITEIKLNRRQTKKIFTDLNTEKLNRWKCGWMDFWNFPWKWDYPSWLWST